MRLWTVAAHALALSPGLTAQDHTGHGVIAPTAPAPAPVREESLPPSEQQAKAVLEKSPRHGEFVDVKMPSGAPVKTWVVYPERKDKAGVVILIHEIFGLSDWIRGVADQLAREGFITKARATVSCAPRRTARART